MVILWLSNPVSNSNSESNLEFELDFDFDSNSDSDFDHTYGKDYAYFNGRNNYDDDDTADNEVTGQLSVEVRELESIQMLNLTANSLVGAFPDELCSRAISGGMHINGDAANCPNGFDGSLGRYVPGCFQDILINVDIYLSYFASFVLGDANCRGWCVQLHE